jgi:hypothetical protein
MSSKTTRLFLMVLLTSALFFLRRYYCEYIGYVHNICFIEKDDKYICYENSYLIRQQLVDLKDKIGFLNSNY